MIHHFYHIYADGQWQNPVAEHIRALKMGLIDSLNTFSIGIVGSANNRNDVKKFLNDNSVGYTLVAESETGWEQVTQIPMWEFSRNNDGVILYAHTKGSSNPSDVNIRWRRSMIYWNVIRWQDAIEKLKEHGAYGCHWIQPLITGMPEHKQGNFMFAGTFFWTHCHLMRTWNRPALTHRHEAEGFIGYGWHQSNFPVWDCTPYFPNSDEFADGWINNDNFEPSEKGRSYA